MDILDKIIIDALNEDMPSGDITTDNIFDDNHTSKAQFIAKEDGIFAGCDVLCKTFNLSGGNTTLDILVIDGQSIKKGDVIARISGSTKTILKGERVALNLVQRMSGIASTTALYVKELVGNTKILDTRKTTPNLRYIEKLAVKIGGGTNHRYSLSDMVMLKDNHINAVGSISKAVSIMKEKVDTKIEVEVETLEQFKEALNTQCDIIMLDNMTNELTKECVILNNGLKKLEASGNMTLNRIKEVSMLGVDYISVGALTHSVKSLDISLKF